MLLSNKHVLPIILVYYICSIFILGPVYANHLEKPEKTHRRQDEFNPDRISSGMNFMQMSLMLDASVLDTMNNSITANGGIDVLVSYFVYVYCDGSESPENIRTEAMSMKFGNLTYFHYVYKCAHMNRIPLACQLRRSRYEKRQGTIAGKNEMVKASDGRNVFVKLTRRHVICKLSTNENTNNVFNFPINLYMGGGESSAYSKKLVSEMDKSVQEEFQKMFDEEFEKEKKKVQEYREMEEAFQMMLGPKPAILLVKYWVSAFCLAHFLSIAFAAVQHLFQPRLYLFPISL